MASSPASTPTTVIDPDPAAIHALSQRLDRMMRMMEEGLAKMKLVPQATSAPPPSAFTVSTASLASASATYSSSSASTTTPIAAARGTSSTSMEFASTSAGTLAASTAAFFPAKGAGDDAAPLSLPLTLPPADADGIPASGAGAGESVGPAVVDLLPARTTASGDTTAVLATSPMPTTTLTPSSTSTASASLNPNMVLLANDFEDMEASSDNIAATAFLPIAAAACLPIAFSHFSIHDASTPAGHPNDAQKVFDEMSPQQKVLGVLDAVGRNHITETAICASSLVFRSTEVEDDYGLQGFLGVRGHRICKASTKQLKYLKWKPALIGKALSCCLSPQDSNPIHIDDGRARYSTCSAFCVTKCDCFGAKKVFNETRIPHEVCVADEFGVIKQDLIAATPAFTSSMAVGCISSCKSANTGSNHVSAAPVLMEADKIPNCHGGLSVEMNRDCCVLDHEKCKKGEAILIIPQHWPLLSFQPAHWLVFSSSRKMLVVAISTPWNSGGSVTFAWTCSSVISTGAEQADLAQFVIQPKPPWLSMDNQESFKLEQEGLQLNCSWLLTTDLFRFRPTPWPSFCCLEAGPWMGFVFLTIGLHVPGIPAPWLSHVPSVQVVTCLYSEEIFRSNVMTICFWRSILRLAWTVQQYPTTTT